MQEDSQVPLAPQELPAIPRSQPELPSSSKGKKVLLVLLSMLLIVTAGIGGWYYGTNQAQKKADAQAAELNAKIASLKKENDTLKAEESSTDASINKNFVVIKEWGVEIPISSSLTGLKYTIGTTSDTEKIPAAAFTSGVVCKNLSQPVSNGAILRVTTTSAPYAGSTIKDQFTASMIKKVGNYYYVFQPTTGHGSCELTDAQTKATAATDTALLQAFSGIKSTE